VFVSVLRVMFGAVFGIMLRAVSSVMVGCGKNHFKSVAYRLFSMGRKGGDLVHYSGQSNITLPQSPDSMASKPFS
jgi:hypothetical protein